MTQSGVHAEHPTMGRGVRNERDLYIDGQWRAASDGARMPVTDPATGEIVDSVARATVADVEAAIEAADRGWAHWRGRDPWDRSRLLRRVADLIRDRAGDLAEVLTEEEGKTLAESRAELAAAADQFEWYADEARRIYGRIVEPRSPHDRVHVSREPIGPVAAFTPWNYPALLPARKLAPALAAGCSVILKPASEAPRTALCLAQACHDAGIPPGVLNVVTGDSTMISRQLLLSGRVRKASVTASTDVGRDILRLAAEHVIPVTLELGGHAPVLVFADADLDLAIGMTARAKFRNAGQVCVAPSRILVERTVSDAFALGFTEAVGRLKLGDGRDPATDVGPLANLRRVEATEALVQDAVDKGARLLAGGRRPSWLRRGFFFEPTVLDSVPPQASVMTTEPFGPIAAIATFNCLTDALTLANAVPYGLAGYVFTGSMRTAVLAAEGLQVGMVGINDAFVARAEAPFGGVKHSGYRREGGLEGIEAYLTTKCTSYRI